MVYVFLAEGFEEIEALTPVDVLRRAGQPVQTVGIGEKTVTGAHGIAVTCDIGESEVSIQDLDMVVLPGGMPGTLNLGLSQKVLETVKTAVDQGKWVAAICAAPSILGREGHLHGRKATCFPGFETELEGAYIQKDAVCVDGRFVTAKGMGVALEFALKLVELLTSREEAQCLKASLQCGA